MSQNYHYSRKYLIKKYVEKAEKIKDIPSVKNIEKDPDMPSYRTYKRRFGDLDKVKELKKVRDRFKNKNKIDRLICEFCVKNPRNCDRDVEECKKEADLFLEFQNDK
ncbi:homing endonuclease associated repeat-containing protein [Halanaerobium sp. MA284_MarDTE_T2]|uniref:homing endonuclease associated repeat-containing protein n=1 Tax=Halanaerobium sp. MA284_MarDTE_T2 TaxID=2183913 RepID=UPI000DF2B79D|nr:hypothetical protein [Halanaerobium sp. MA284_MarDTE_T2]RCW44737.1 hypothetical protein DFR78_1196 [Halanaerobium sp. MA284_MarDTE_T2]